MKIKSKTIISILLAVAVVPALVGSCCSKFIPSAYADDSETVEQGREILDNTRYSAVGFAPFVKTIVDFVGGVLAGEIADGLLDSTDTIDTFAVNSAVDSYLQLKNYAISSTNPITIQEVVSLIGKRKIIYPWDDMVETDYFFLYLNGNVQTAQVQQFGEYTIAPNSLLIVRQTSWAGVLVGSIDVNKSFISFPNVANNFTMRIGNNSSGIVVHTPDGDVTEHITTLFSGGYYEIPFINNEYNTIADLTLTDYYSSHPTTGLTPYLTDGEALNFVECLIGVPLNDTGDQALGGRGVKRPIYLTTLYSNNHARWKNTMNDDPSNIDPIKPPVYILPTTDPLAYGQQITENNISNYNDYGMTIIDGHLDIDPTILAGALGAQITPDFKAIVDGVYSAQPQIGLDFDTPLELDIPSIVDTYIDTLIPQLPSGSVTRPLVPTVTTLPDWNLLPSYTTETMPQYVLDTVDDVNTSIIDITDAMEITGIFMILALIGLLIYAIF